MPVPAALVAFGLQATVILVLALVASRCLRRASAASRHLVWAGALAAIALLPVASQLLPALPLAVLASSGPLENLPAGVTDRGDLSGMLLALWGLGAAGVFLRQTAGWRGVRRLRRRAVELDDPGVWREARGLARRLGVRRPVALLAHPERLGPLTWGVARPVILLPADASHWSEERRRIVLIHELGHVARFDALTQAVGQIALALAWFHPLAWLAVRREELERERACDDLVLEQGVRASHYAGELIALARFANGGLAPPAAVAAIVPRSQLEGRLLAVLDPGVERGGVTRRAALALAVLLAAALTLAAVRPVEVRPVEVKPGASVRMAAGPARAWRGVERKSIARRPEEGRRSHEAPARAASLPQGMRLGVLVTRPQGLARETASLAPLGGRMAPLRGKLILRLPRLTR